MGEDVARKGRRFGTATIHSKKSSQSRDRKYSIELLGPQEPSRSNQTYWFVVCAWSAFIANNIWGIWAEHFMSATTEQNINNTNKLSSQNWEPEQDPTLNHLWLERNKKGCREHVSNLSQVCHAKVSECTQSRWSPLWKHHYKQMYYLLGGGGECCWGMTADREQTRDRHLAKTTQGHRISS